MVRNIILIAGLMLTLEGCQTLDFKRMILPLGPGVEKRFEQSMKMTSGEATSSLEIQEDYELYVCTDPHVDKSSIYLEKFTDLLFNDPDASFGILLGDCTDRKDNLEAYMKAVAYSENRHLHEHPLFHVLGNHDVYFNGWEDFSRSIGPSVYWFEARFTAGADLYISLDSANGTLGGKQTKWLKSFLAEKRKNYRHCFILTHTNFFYTDCSQASSGNLPLDETLGLIDLFDKHDITLVLQGHDHTREDLKCGNVRYTVIGSISDKVKKPEFLKIRVSGKNVAYDWVLL